MLKAICIGVLLTALPLMALSQYRYGMKGGVNFADVVINNVNDPDAESDFKMKAGFVLGFFGELDLSERFVLGAELLYAVKGVKAVGTNINLNYATIPVLMKYRITETVRAEAGLELGYLISATSPYGNVGSVWDNKIDLGIDAGVDYRINRIIAGLRLNAGMSSVIRNTSSGINSERVRYQNRVISVAIAYLFATSDN